MFAERVLQGSVSPGAATIIPLTAPETGWRSFVAAFGTGQPCYYYIEDTNTGAWELGSGTVTAGSPDTLTRTTVIRNSLGTLARVDFTGTVLVYNDLIAPTSVGRQLFLAADEAAARAVLGQLMHVVGTFTVSGSPVDWTVALPAAFPEFVLRWSGLSPTADAALGVRFSWDGGSTYPSGASEYTGGLFYSDTSGVTNIAPTTTSSQGQIGFNTTGASIGSFGDATLTMGVTGVHTTVLRSQTQGAVPTLGVTAGMVYSRSTTTGRPTHLRVRWSSGGAFVNQGRIVLAAVRV